MFASKLFFISLIVCGWTYISRNQKPPWNLFENLPRRSSSDLEREEVEMEGSKAGASMNINPMEKFPNPFGGDPWHGDGFDLLFKNFFQRPNVPSWFSPEFPAFQSHQPWWKGPNICAEKKEIEGKVESKSGQESRSFQPFSIFLSSSPSSLFTMHSTQCVQNDNAYMCTTRILNDKENKTIIETYQCCNGFKRIPEFGNCVKFEMMSVADTLRKAGSSKMAGMIMELEKEGHYNVSNTTIFAPSDEAMDNYEYENMNKKQNEILTISTETDFDEHFKNVESLIVSGIHRVNDMKNEDILRALDNSKIRINVYRNPIQVVTANCAPFIGMNNHANNSIIHVIDRILQVPSKSVSELIDENPALTTFKNLIGDDSMKSLKNNGHYTIFAPSNSAFQNIDPTVLEKLMKGKGCSKEIINSHISENVICSCAFGTHGNVLSKSSHYLTIQNDGNNIFIDGAKITSRDILGTNGVIHILDSVILPEITKPISNLLRRPEFSEFSSIITKSGKLSEWDELSNVSFLIPTNEAIRSLSNEEKDLLIKKVNSLVINEEVSIRTLPNNKILSNKNNEKVRLNFYRDNYGFGIRPTFQCAPIIQSEIKVCGGQVHVTDEIPTTTDMNIVNILDSMDQFNLTSKIIAVGGMRETLEREGTPLTFIAPTDEAILGAYKKVDIDDLLNNSKSAESFIKRHTFHEILCCAGITNSPIFSHNYRNLEGKTIGIHRDFLGRIKIHELEVAIKKCDLMANNGVIHVAHRVMQRYPYPKSPIFEMIFKK